MARNIYPQSEYRQPPTLTVGELIKRLSVFEPDLPVIFRSPLHGAFGGNTAYTVEALRIEDLERREEHHPASEHVDDETGELVVDEAYTHVFEAWTGVVLS